ncbi:hypothetical protein JYU20_00520 [Bacteroidales bacterium AH-315-I05]|nr:hypothetical protein [Bacteroidales bacterium AH-315-I05]
MRNALIIVVVLALLALAFGFWNKQQRKQSPARPKRAKLLPETCDGLEMPATREGYKWECLDGRWVEIKLTNQFGNTTYQPIAI